MGAIALCSIRPMPTQAWGLRYYARIGSMCAGALSILREQLGSRRWICDDATEGIEQYEPLAQSPVSIVRKMGADILNDPVYNKGTAFPRSERERLGIRGLLPASVAAVEVQKQRVLEDYYRGNELVDPKDVKDDITSEMVRKWQCLQSLQDRNETLFYKILCDNIAEMAPIIYTPTVGWVCMNYHRLWRRPRGMFFSAQDKGEMASMVWNWPQGKVDAIVVTDGSRILGLGDLGMNGMGIPIGKLDLYVAAGGFHPGRVLPCVIDMGTDNEALRNDPWYMGSTQPRIQGTEYFEILDEFVAAVMSRWPNAVLQFEDFSIDHALPLLERYRWNHLVFNDDIQGTAATAVAGLYGAMRVQGHETKAIRHQRIVVLGAGSAGMGVISLIAKGMRHHGLHPQEAQERFWVLDSKGLMTTARAEVKQHVLPFTRRDQAVPEGSSLLEVVKAVKPTVIIGLAGAGRLFSEEVLREMAKHCAQPIVMPMSNPTSKMECTADEAQRWTDGRAIFASGSPQRDVEWNGQTIASSQANNMYTFPGLALGALLGQTQVISNDMIMGGAEAIPTMLTPEELQRRQVFPDLNNIRNISAKVAVHTMMAAAAEGRLQGRALERLARSEEALLEWVHRNMFSPQYTSLIHLPVGVEE